MNPLLFQCTANMDNGASRNNFSQYFELFFNGDEMLVTNLGTTCVNGPLMCQGPLLCPNNVAIGRSFYNNETPYAFEVVGNSLFSTADVNNACITNVSIVNACISSLSITNACICNLSLMGNIFAVNGYFTNNVIAGYSDERMKIKTSNISNSLDKITSLSCFKYYPNTSVCEQLGIKQDYTVDIGLSAQEVQKCFPEIVCLSPYDININEVTNEVVSRTGLDLLTIRYERFVPIIIQCIQELQAQRLQSQKYDKNTECEKVSEYIVSQEWCVPCNDDSTNSTSTSTKLELVIQDPGSYMIDVNMNLLVQNNKRSKKNMSIEMTISLDSSRPDTSAFVNTTMNQCTVFPMNQVRPVIVTEPNTKVYCIIKNTGTTNVVINESQIRYVKMS